MIRVDERTTRAVNAHARAVTETRRDKAEGGRAGTDIPDGEQPGPEPLVLSPPPAPFPRVLPGL